ncbi:MAG: spermidine/putrescine ABC transporter substrate-binding protein, partial [Pseudomonadota bacterium]
EGGDWQLLHFREADLVWMDTLNFVADLKDKRLEAAEMVANYFIGKAVQNRVVTELSLVSVSSLVDANPVLEAKPAFFAEGSFVPPYHVLADNLMTRMSNDAFKAAGVPAK